MSTKNKPKLVGILRNENPESAKNWIKACEDYNINYKVIDLSSAYWLEKVLAENFDFFLLKPSGRYEHHKTMYDERTYIISEVLGFKTFPSFKENLLYENKKILSYYLAAEDIPHPQTWVFYNFHEAKQFIENAAYPFVAKTTIGAAGSGVKFLINKAAALSYIKTAFKGKGIRRRFGPNRIAGNPKKWFIKALNSPRYLVKKLKYYFEVQQNAQKNFVIFQEYIPHDYEWKLVKVDESYFAHKKIKVKDKASGSKKKEFGMPDLKLMDFVHTLCEKHDLNTVDVDVFEHEGKYLVNEIQCIFGIPFGYLMKVDNESGRLRKIAGEWKFEAGDFTKNDCYNLRLLSALKLFGYGDIKNAEKNL